MSAISDYHFHPSLFLRTPVNSYDFYRKASIAEVLKDSFFKCALFLASESLYWELERRKFDYDRLSENGKSSLQKYFNRMCYRPTPFGLFAGFSVANWGSPNRPLILQDQLKLHARCSYEQSLAIVEEYIDNQLMSSLFYVVNSSIYQVGDEYRYLRYEQGTEETKRKFFIDSFERSTPLESILFFCRSERTKANLSKFISEQFTADEEEGQAFSDQLIKKQIIVPAIQPNLTGKDYLQMIWDLTTRSSADSAIPKIKTLPSTNLSKVVSGEKIRLEELFGADQLEGGSIQMKASELYVNLERPDVAGCLDKRYQEKILDGLYCINRLVQARIPTGLQRFITAFKEKYDRRSVPILEALDPEVGVGYEGLGGNHSSSILLKDMAVNYPAKEEMSIEWTKVHSFLMEKWNESNDRILLTAEDIAKLPDLSQQYSLPPSISVLFRLSSDKIYIEQAGGATATSLLGRFTFFSDGVLRTTEDIVRAEEEANPDVIFAEIAHLSDTRVANIERRKLVRQYEIPVLTGSVVAPQHQTLLSDLWITVSGNRIRLWSRKHKKQVVPRLTSAFNYKRSDLSVFRFLCDLQYQDLKANLNFDLSEFFPGLLHYPRVQYKSTILQLATWNIREDHVQNLVKLESSSERIAHLRKLATEWQWPQYVSLNRHDHQLVINIENEEDCCLLVDALKNFRQVVVIKEYPFTGERSSIITDRKGNPYIGQFVASLYHQQKVYHLHDHPFANEIAVRQAIRKIIPGGEWLYIKLYCRSLRSDELLTRYILPVTNSLKAKGSPKKWFFIRYADPEYHLRIRFKVSPASLAELMALLNAKIDPLIQAGIISNFQVDIYERELERYSPDLIEEIENVSCASSSLVALYLMEMVMNEGDYGYYNQVFSSIDYLLNVFGYSLDKKVASLKVIFEAFYLEFEGSRKLNDQLKRKFREMRDEGVLAITPPEALFTKPLLRQLLAEFGSSLADVAAKIEAWDEDKKRVLVSDLIHLHLNRLLTDAHRKQELVIYYCLWKQYDSIRARIQLGQALAF